MDRPVLEIFARELAESESLAAFADVVGRADARVSEPALPLLLSALHMRLQRGLVCLLPEDAEARDAAEAAAWPVTTACARSPRRSGRMSSSACASASGVRGEGTAARSPTTC